MDRLSSAPTDCRVPDPTDAKADGAFGGNHRAGYGDRLDRIIATARKGWTLAAGEGLVLVQEIDRMQGAVDATLDHLSFLQDENDRLRGELELVSSEAADAYHAIDRRDEELAQQSITLGAEHQRAERILAALREPSEKVLLAAVEAVPYGASYAALTRCIPAAVAAAEQEVRR